MLKNKPTKLLNIFRMNVKKVGEELKSSKQNVFCPVGFGQWFKLTASLMQSCLQQNLQRECVCLPVLFSDWTCKHANVHPLEDQAPCTWACFFFFFFFKSTPSRSNQRIYTFTRRCVLACTHAWRLLTPNAVNHNTRFIETQSRLTFQQVCDVKWMTDPHLPPITAFNKLFSGHKTNVEVTQTDCPLIWKFIRQNGTEGTSKPDIPYWFLLPSTLATSSSPPSLSSLGLLNGKMGFASENPLTGKCLLSLIETFSKDH